MGDMGLQGAYGAQGAADALRQLIKDRLAQQMATQEMTLRQSQETRLGEEHAAAMQDRLDQHAAIRQEHQTGLANTLGDQIPAGTEMAPTDQGVGLLQSGGRGSLLRGNMTLPSTQTAGGMTMPDDSGGSQITGTLRSMASPEALRSYTKLPSEKQGEYADTAAAKVEAARLAAENRTNDNEQKAKDRLAQIQAAAAGRPVAEHLKKVEHKDPATGRTVIEYLSDSELRGKSFQKGTGAAAEGRLASAEAVNQTGEDIIQQMSNPAVLQSLGPALGRYSKLSDFIGNPPPEYAELAGQIESYALASMGVHGMRSAQGAAQIKAMLDAHHTPESLAAAIRGLSKFSQHFMQNEGRGQQPTPSSGGSGSVAMKAPDGRTLSVPADKVAEMEAHGAKRVP